MKTQAALGATESLFGDLYKSIDFGKCNGDAMQEAHMKETPLSAMQTKTHWFERYKVQQIPQLSKLAHKYVLIIK